MGLSGGSEPAPRLNVKGAVPPPVISSFSPTSGIVGTVVTVTFANFTGATDATFSSGVAAKFNVANDQTITAIVPKGAVTGKISVTTPAGTGVSFSSFQVAPKIDSFGPTSGIAGTQVTINGSGFTGVTAVKFTAANAVFTAVDDFTIKDIVPSSGKDGKIQVITPVGTATSGSSFNVIKPVLNSFAPPKGTVGITVSFFGDDLDSTTAVSFNGTLATQFVATVTKVQAVVPKGATTGKVPLTTISGPLVTAGNFSVLPEITSFSPTVGPVGTQVTIKGSGFTGTTSVKFTAASAAFSFIDDFTLKATVPPAAQSGKIQVTTINGITLSPTSFTIT